MFDRQGLKLENFSEWREGGLETAWRVVWRHKVLAVIYDRKLYEQVRDIVEGHNGVTVK